MYSEYTFGAAAAQQNAVGINKAADAGVEEAALMELISNLALGFSVSLHPINLFFGFAGVTLGVIIGILPGLGSAATIALLLPITYFLDTTTAVIMLAGIWYGSMYGGSITSILLRVPGEAASVMVAIDGHELTKQGRAGAALGMSIFSAFIAGMVGLLGLGLVAPTLGEFALDFGPPEYFALTLLGLTLVSYLATDSVWKAVAVTLFGLLLGTVGLDPVRSSARFTFGTLSLQSGIDLVPMVMGLFGISEVFHLIEARPHRRAPAETGPCATRFAGRLADPPGLARCAARDRSGNVGRIFCRPAARRRGDDFVLCGLCRGQALGQAAAEIRQRRDRRSGGTGVGGQCGDMQRVHPAAHPGLAGQRRDGADPRCLHAARGRAGTHVDVAAAPHLLGHRDEHVHRKLHFDLHHAADDRSPGEDHAHSQQHPRIGHRAGLRRRRLWCEQQCDGHHHHDGVRRAWLPDDKIRLPARPIGACLRSRPDHGD